MEMYANTPASVKAAIIVMSVTALAMGVRRTPEIPSRIK